jgi:hypothetical protein
MTEATGYPGETVTTISDAAAGNLVARLIAEGLASTCNDSKCAIIWLAVAAWPGDHYNDWPFSAVIQGKITIGWGQEGTHEKTLPACCSRNDCGCARIRGGRHYHHWLHGLADRPTQCRFNVDRFVTGFTVGAVK